MIELVYYSNSKVDVTSEVLSNILIKSRANNSKKHITGCLLYHNNVFLQLLEGEKEDVQNLYKIIEQDERHSNVTLLLQEDVKERRFPKWSMAFKEYHSIKYSDKHFIKEIILISKNNKKETKAINMFWNMVKQTVV